MNYQGVIIEESLENKDILKDVKISDTKVEEVVEEHKTPWIKQWTLHTVEIPENEAGNVAKKISKALDSEHNWYADFKNDSHHYIIFRDKVFYIDRKSKEQYDEAKRYGISLRFGKIISKACPVGNLFSFGVCEGFNSGGGHSGVFRPASVLNSIKTPDVIWDFDFRSSAPKLIFCPVLAYRSRVLNRVSPGNLVGSK